MSDYMRIRVEGKGDYGWQYQVIDVDTGKVLPVTSLKLEWTPSHEPVCAVITVQIAEVFIETVARRKEDVLRVETFFEQADIETRRV